MSTIKVSRKTFQDWVEICDASFYQEPAYNHSKIAIEGKFENGVEWVLRATALTISPQGIFYGRHNDWNLVKLSNYSLENFHFHGKGSRSIETWKLAEELFQLLVDQKLQ